MNRPTSFLLAALALALPVAALPATPAAQPANVPNTLWHQGRLLDGNDVPVDGPLDATFAIYPEGAPAAGHAGAAALWTQKYTLKLRGGQYAVELGDAVAGTALPADLFTTAGERWLGITIGTGQELTPRLHIAMTPFARTAASALDARQLGGRAPDYYGTAADVASKVAVVTATAPFTVGGTPTAPELSLAPASAAKDGYLAAADYAKFSAKQGALSIQAPLLLGADGALAVASATSVSDGALTAVDWAKFTAKAEKSGEAGYVNVNAAAAQAGSFNLAGNGAIGGSLTADGIVYANGGIKAAILAAGVVISAGLLQGATVTASSLISTPVLAASSVGVGPVVQNATAGRLSVSGRGGEVSLMNRQLSTWVEGPTGKGERYAIYVDGTAASASLRIWSGGDKVTINAGGDITSTGLLTSALFGSVAWPIWASSNSPLLVTSAVTGLSLPGSNPAYGPSLFHDWQHYMGGTFTQARVAIFWAAANTSGAADCANTLELHRYYYLYPKAGNYYLKITDFTCRATDGLRGARWDWTDWIDQADFASGDVGGLGFRAKGTSGYIYNVVVYLR